MSYLIQCDKCGKQKPARMFGVLQATTPAKWTCHMDYAKKRELHFCPECSKKAPTMAQSLSRIRAAGGKVWDGIKDPELFIKEMRGGE